MTDTLRPAAKSATAFAQSLPADYRARFNPAEIAAHAHVALARPEGRVGVGAFPTHERGLTAICVAAEDRPGLFARITGALVESGFDVESAAAYRTSDNPSVAVDLFWLRDPQAKVSAEDLGAFREILDETLRGTRRENIHLPASPPSGFRDTTVRFVEESGGALATLEVETQDHSGLLWSIANALHQASVDITGSQVRTEGGQVFDRFTVAELDGSPISSARRLAIQIAVLSAIEH